MPDNILSDFFYGNIVPSEKQFDKNSEFGRAIDELAEEEIALRTKLSGEALEQFEQVCQLQGDVTEMTAKEYYIDGFRTGFRIALCVLNDCEKTNLSGISDG